MSKYTILYVAHDAPAGNSIGSSLRSASYQLITTDSASQAIALLYVNRRIDAVILDQRCGNQEGPVLARALKSLRSNIPILLISGHSGEPPAPSDDADGCVCIGDDVNALAPALETLFSTPAM